MKIEKSLLHNSKGFYIENRYSKDDNTDDMGRWARIIYFNGFCIVWIHGNCVGKQKIIEPKKIGKVNRYLVHLLFPCSANQGGDVKVFDDLTEAIKYSKEIFFDFRNLINK